MKMKEHAIIDLMRRRHQKWLAEGNTQSIEVDRAAVNLMLKRREKQTAERKLQLAETERAIYDLEAALQSIISATFDSGAPIVTILNAVRQCEATLLQQARVLRAQGRGPKTVRD